MSKYAGVVRSISPSLTDDNWTLNAAANEFAKVLEVHWGGEVTTSTAMCTRVAYSSGSAGAETTGNVAELNEYGPANLVSFVLTFATTQPTLDAGDLFAESWNAHGGVVRWLAAPGEEFVLIGANTISCRNSVGTGTSTYGTIWEEA